MDFCKSLRTLPSGMVTSISLPFLDFYYAVFFPFIDINSVFYLGWSLTPL